MYGSYDLISLNLLDPSRLRYKYCTNIVQILTTLAKHQRKTGESKDVHKIKLLRITLDTKRKKIIDEIERFLSDWMVKWVSPKKPTQTIHTTATLKPRTTSSSGTWFVFSIISVLLLLIVRFYSFNHYLLCFNGQIINLYAKLC